LFHWNGSHGVKVLRKALTEILQNQYGVQILSEHQLSGHTAQWPVIVVPGWAHLEPEFRGELVLYAKSGGRLVLIGSGPRKLFETELGSTSNLSIVQVNEVDQAFSSVLKQVLPNPVVKVVGAKDLDVSPRMLNGNLTIHLVNTSGPHANAPDGGITEVKPLGPLTVSISLAKAPKAILMQPQGTSLDVTWSNGRAQVTLPQLDLYSILVVKP
ncbi:MAG: hypothetical protein HQ515_13690, partial [Phycisphaeraceae bacterium]|nr:hypothetical protein [Phycisphaeraceae bacterium]